MCDRVKELYPEVGLCGVIRCPDHTPAYLLIGHSIPNTVSECIAYMMCWAKEIARAFFAGWETLVTVQVVYGLSPSVMKKCRDIRSPSFTDVPWGAPSQRLLSKDIVNISQIH